jgi:hypothetical protein
MSIQSSPLWKQNIVKPEVVIWPNKNFMGKPLVNVKMSSLDHWQTRAGDTKPGKVTNAHNQRDEEKDEDDLRSPRETSDTRFHRERFLLAVVLREKTSVILLFVHKRKGFLSGFLTLVYTMKERLRRLSSSASSWYAFSG